jgi:hypothetical protein
MGTSREAAGGDQKTTVRSRIGHGPDQLPDCTGSNVALVPLALYDARPPVSIHHQINASISAAPRLLHAIASSLKEQAHVRLEFRWGQRADVPGSGQSLPATLLYRQFDQYASEHDNNE